MLGLLSTGKKLTIGLVGAGRAADRGFIDCRNNIATSTKALTTNTSVQLICHSPLSLHLHNSYTEPDFLTLIHIHPFQILSFRFAHFPDALRDNGQIVYNDGTRPSIGHFNAVTLTSHYRIAISWSVALQF